MKQEEINREAASPRPSISKLLQEGARERAKKLLLQSSGSSSCDCINGGTAVAGPFRSPQRGGDPGGAVLKGLRALGWRQQYQFSRVYRLGVRDVTLEVRQIEMGEVTGLGTGANVWPAAVVLAKYLEKKYGDHDKGMTGLRVADLGCGTGLTGLAAAILGAEVYLTDQAQILFLARENADKCSEALGHGVLPPDRVHVVEYDWGGDDRGLQPLPLDVVLVSDCLLPKLYPIEPLVDALDKLSGPSTRIIVSFEPRNFPDYDPVSRFDELLSGRGLARRRVGDGELDQEYWADDIEVWEITRRGGAEEESTTS